MIATQKRPEGEKEVKFIMKKEGKIKSVF